MCSAELGVRAWGQRTVLSTVLSWGEEWVCVFSVTLRTGGTGHRTLSLCFTSSLEAKEHEDRTEEQVWYCIQGLGSEGALSVLHPQDQRSQLIPEDPRKLSSDSHVCAVVYLAV